jgi:glyoxylase-like metal-dependent hydrolase (beta-lactamase superfamily II)
MSREPYTDLGHGITCIDTGLFGEHLAACYLVQGNSAAALVDTGGNHGVPRVLAAIEAAGVRPEEVLYVMPTHVHLDHGSASGALLEHLPNAKVVVHPNGARHLRDPSRLWESAAAVYGEDTLLRDYGRMVPVPEERMIAAPDGFEVDLGGRRLLVLDTPGHARHHFSVWDEVSRGFFTGDTFGASYRHTDSAKGAFIMLSATPVQFEPEAWRETLARYASYGPRCMYLTHYGRVEEVERLTADLLADMDLYVEIALRHADAEDPFTPIKDALVEHTMARLRQHDSPMSEPEALSLLEMDMALNAQGLVAWLERTRRRKAV